MKLEIGLVWEVVEKGRRKQPFWIYKQLPHKGLAQQEQRLSAFWVWLTEGWYGKQETELCKYRWKEMSRLVYVMRSAYTEAVFKL